MQNGLGPMARLIEVMAALRTPGSGCPWDLQQTFRTIAPYTIEEAYEVADAITRENMRDLKEELGDLLLQVVYHARIAQEQGAFTFAEVADGITAKMIRRHPHVFGSAGARGLLGARQSGREASTSGATCSGRRQRS
jgi:ATP diphosphatase